ncbi:MAG: HNH endonuclease [Candidatus Omnitrophica bacterium]|nr:HNH endonuclease [Candidatus Omnitrophota bacterium]
MSKEIIYARKLYDQELGYRKGQPKKAGRYFFISKECIAYFPPLSTLIKNDHILIKIIPPDSQKIVLSNYVYHNDKITDNKSHGRDEYRLYLNSETDTERNFFKPGDIAVLYRYAVENESIYKIFYFPVSQKDNHYKRLEAMIEESRIKGGHALIEASKIPFIRLPSRIDLEDRVIPKEVMEDVLSEPLEPLPAEVMENEFLFTRTIRENNFRELLLFFYDYRCAVTGSAMRYKNLINLQAAHIIPDEHGGPPHPKNGLPLSRDLHWAFDIGFFTVDDQYEINVHEKVKDIQIMREINNRKIILPQDNRAWPSIHSLKWHRDNVFGIFTSKTLEP